MKKRKTYGIRIVGAVMALITAISFAGCSAKKNDSKIDGSKDLTTDSYSDKTTGDNEKNDITVTESDGNKPTASEAVNSKDGKLSSGNAGNANNAGAVKSLDSILKELENNTAKFSPDVRSYLKDLVKNAYNNYDNLADVLCKSSLPDKCTFLEEKIINPLKRVNSIEIISSDNPDFYELKREYETSRWLEDEKKIIVFCDGYNENNYPQILMEEIIHSGQEKLNTAKLGYSEYCIFAEGEANSFAWPLTFGKINNSGIEIFYDDESMNNTNYGYGTAYFTHALATKYYMYLLTLTDYDTVNKFKKTLDSDVITDKISKLYGIDGAEFYNEMKDVIADAVSDIYDKRTPQMVYCEKVYNTCMNKKISNIGNAKEAKEVLNLYRYMNIQYGYEYSFYDEKNDIYVDKTNEKTGNLKTIDNLYNKCKKYGAFGVSDNSTKDKKAFHAFVSPERNSDENIYFISCSNAAVKLEGDNLTVSNNLGTYQTNINDLSSKTIKSNYNYLDKFTDLNNVKS